MLKSVYCTNNNTCVQLDNFDNISDVIQNQSNVIWIDALAPSPKEIIKLAEEFNLHPLAVEDALNRHQRPKIEEYTDHYFIVFYALELNEKTFQLKPRELSIFMGKNYLLTIHSEPLRALDEAERRWARNSELIAHDAGTLLYSVLDSLVDEYHPLLDTIVDWLEDLEEAIFEQAITDKSLTGQILIIRRSLRLARGYISPEREILNALTRRESPIFEERTRLYFQDVYDHVLRAVDSLDICRDTVASVADANLARASNDLNKVMRTLTTASVILMANALIAGIYGMNFQNMPELKWDYGYPIALGLMLLVSFLLIIYFKRRHWF
jgi:magnesium transporter